MVADIFGKAARGYARGLLIIPSQHARIATAKTVHIASKSAAQSRRGIRFHEKLPESSSHAIAPQDGLEVCARPERRAEKGSCGADLCGDRILRVAVYLSGNRRDHGHRWADDTTRGTCWRNAETRLDFAQRSKQHHHCQATEIAGSQDGGLGLAAVIRILVSINAASKALGALIEGLHIAAGETDQRGFLASTRVCAGHDISCDRLAVLALVSTVLVPAALAASRVEDLFAVILGALRWPIVGVATALGLGALYRLSLRHRIAGALWFTPGAVLATLSWLAGSIAFSIYVRESAGYNRRSELWAAWCLC